MRPPATADSCTTVPVVARPYVALVTPRSARAAASIESGSTVDGERPKLLADRRRLGFGRDHRTLHPVPLDELGDQLGRDLVAADAVHLCADRFRSSLERAGEVVRIEEMRTDLGDRGRKGRQRMRGVVRRRRRQSPFDTSQEDALVHQISPARQRSWKVRAAGVGASRPAVHLDRPGARSANRPSPRPVLATFIDARNDFGCDHAVAHVFHAAALGEAGLCSPATSEREEQVLQRDAHRARVHARAAQRRRVRELRRFLVRVGEQRREHRADRSAVDPAVRVATDLAVHGADVQARAAPDARQDLLHLGAEDLAASVVEDDDVQLVGTIGLTLAARPGDDVRVRRQVLPGAGSREQVDEQIELLPVREQALHPHDRDVHTRAPTCTADRFPRS